MKISGPNLKPSKANQQSPPPQQQPPASGNDGRVEKIVDGVYLSANYAASGLGGGIAGLGAYVTNGLPQSVKIAGSALSNVYKTEKLGPTLKLVTLAAAVPAVAIAGAIAAPVSLVAGAWQGVGEVEHSVPRQFTVSEASKEGYTEVKDGINGIAKDVKQELKDLGDYKLKPGEKPLDIPLIKAGKTLLMGAVGAVVGGVAGAVSAVGLTLTEAVGGIAKAAGDDELNIAEKALAAGTSVASAPIQGALYGFRTALSSVGRGLGETWDHDSMGEGLKSIAENAKVATSAAIRPESVLTQERPAS